MHDRPAAAFDGTYAIVALACSAGGIRALSRVLGALPAGFPVPIVVVQHLDPRHETVIADVLGRQSRLRVTLAKDHDQLKAGTVYIAPPNRHLLVDGHGRVTLSSADAVHFSRPSADVLLESVAAAYGPRAIACVLTGSGTDGATGAAAVRARGGHVLVEDPATAEFSGMPSAAVASGAAESVLPLDEIIDVLSGLVQESRS